ncbi:MAG: carbohydrate-binding domain-containing protein [Clostridiales bacterium]|nr:carbohydrate-binding domain-containing protein [Candidatus Cacconaster stercorequi]
MSTSKHIDKICIAVIAVMLVITVLFMFGEKLGITAIHREEDEETSEMFTANDLNADWDTTDACKIILNGDSAKISGNGAYFSNNALYIAYAGKYVISGTLDGSVHIDADGDDKIWLLFDDVDITSKTEPPLYIKQADKVFLTLKENSQNTLAFENEDEDAKIDGCIFSRDDLTVNGKGTLTVTSSGLHGIVCNDSLVFTGGNINITAKKDAVHAHDAIKICNTDIAVSAGDDGLHAGNDDESAVFYLESGNINITECYEGIEANDITITGGTVNITPSDDGINANGSGKTSLITVSGGDITVINKNGRDADGFDSNGSINITGGNVFISVTGTGTNNAIDYGSENGGKCTISGGTVIACGSSQMAEYPDSDSTQGFIMGTVSGSENETISVLGADGKEIISKEIPCSFTSVIISSPDITVGDTVTLKVGDTETEVTANNTESGGMGGFGNQGGFNPGDRNRQGDFPGQGGQNPFENGDGNTPPELPNGSGEGGTFLQRPNEDNDPPQKPDGNLPSSDMPEGQNGTPPEMPSGDNQGGPQRPDGNMPGENSNRDNKKGQNPVPDNKTDNTNNRIEQSNKPSDIPISTWIMIGISAIVLISGLLIAVKKKY